MNTKVLTVGMLAIGSFIAAQAVPISGEIKFGSTAPLSLTGGAGNWATATGFDFSPISSPVPGLNAIVNLGATGSFTGLDLTFASFKDFTFAPLPVGGADVWEISGGVFAFHLDSVTVTRGVNSIILTGSGVVSGPGWDDTVGSFQFSTQGGTTPRQTFSFSANNKVDRVPDVGGSVALLGLALMGLGFAGRRWA